MNERENKIVFTQSFNIEVEGETLLGLKQNRKLKNIKKILKLLQIT